MRLAMGVILLGAAALPATAQQSPAQNPAQSPAQALPLPPELTQLLAQPEHRAALLQAARAVNGPAAPACPTASYAPTGDVVVLAPAQADSHGKLISGAWKESLRETGCGSDRTINTLTAVGQGGAPQTQPLLPGDTISDPQLQHDSVQYAAGGMGDMPPGCDQGAITNTRFVGLDGQPPNARPVAGAPPKPWTEVWSLKACNKTANVTMHFTPDATGTEIRADPAG